MTTSPMLNTLASGQPRGIAQMSPRNNRRGWSSNPEFVNLSAFEARPADRTAAGPAGITPALAAMAIRFNAPPTATIQIPEIRRFTQRNVNNIP